MEAGSANPDAAGGQVQSRIEVRPASSFGWVWRADQHECAYECGAGGCDGQGWRLTRRWAERAAARYVRGKDHRAQRTAVGWLVPDPKIAASTSPPSKQHPDRPWHDDWMRDLPHGDHEPIEDCLRCYAERLWQAYEAERARNTLMDEVAHRAWHLLDDGGEQDNDPEEFVAFMSDAKRLSDALDALEATGWNGCATAPAASQMQDGEQ